jgi:crotonobetainyl-CoA:carnitine CoA-transferase CaiB-like acyl-CoA transferase
MTADSEAGPLAGVRVIEWGTNFSVPLASMTLADQGADVIKVEAPSGDTTRHSTAHREGVRGMAASFVVANRNKRSIVLNMKVPEAVDAFKAMLKTADVFVQNFRPGVMQRFGLAYEDLKKIKPDLIAVSVTGFGDHGPYAKQRVWDSIIQAVSGLMALQADAITGMPSTMRGAVADKVTALVVSQAITAALYHRAKTGKGQHVEIDMLRAVLGFSWTAMLNELWLGAGVKKGVDFKDLRQVYRAGDGNHLCCSIPISNTEWLALTAALDRQDLTEEPRYAETFDRLRLSEEISQQLAPIFLTRSAAQWLEVLRAHDVTCAPVNTASELHLDPQIIAQGLLVESVHPHAGPYRHAAHPANFHGTPTSNRHHPPMLGEHSDQILQEVGYAPDQVAALLASGAVA